MNTALEIKQYRYWDCRLLSKDHQGLTQLLTQGMSLVNRCLIHDEKEKCCHKVPYRIEI